MPITIQEKWMPRRPNHWATGGQQARTRRREDLGRQRRALGGAGQHQRAGHRRVVGQRRGAPCGVVGAVLDARQELHQRLEALGVGRADRRSRGLARDVAGQGHRGAAQADVLHALRREELVDQHRAARAGVGLGRDALVPALGRLLERMRHGDRGQRLLGLEMPVEPAVREPRGAHQVGDAHPPDAAFAEQAGRGLGDLLAVVFGFGSGDSWHGGRPWMTF
jgi:hypothetical protein